MNVSRCETWDAFFASCLHRFLSMKALIRILLILHLCQNYTKLVAPVHGNIMIVISGPEHGRRGEVLRNVLSLFWHRNQVQDQSRNNLHIAALLRYKTHELLIWEGLACNIMNGGGSVQIASWSSPSSPDTCSLAATGQDTDTNTRTSWPDNIQTYLHTSTLGSLAGRVDNTIY